MLFLPESNIAFLHIPKTGGTFVRKVIKELKIPHEEHSHYHGTIEELEKWKGNIDNFCFVRHPISWLQSYWADRMIQGWGGDLPIAKHCADSKFNKFAQKVSKRYPGFIGELYARSISEKTVVCQTENLEDQLSTLLYFNSDCDETKIYETIDKTPQQNVGTRLPEFELRIKFTQKTKEMVCESEKELLRIYNYENYPPK